MATTPLLPGPFPPVLITALLQASLTMLTVEVRALTGEQRRWRPGPDVWCVNEVIGHLIEAEQRGFAGRIRAILQEDYPTFATWDQPAVARARQDCERDGELLLQEFTALRQASIGLVEPLTPTELARAGYHPMVGELTVRDLLHEWVFHDRSHLQQVLELVKALQWPHMGNSRRFSAPQTDE